MTLETDVSLALSAALTGSLDLGELKSSLAWDFGAHLLDGTGAGQANRIFHDQRTLAASTNEDLDLAGVLLDPLGATLTFARIKALLVWAAAGNTNNVIVGGAAATGFVSWVGGATHTLTVRPGAVLLLAAGEADAIGYVVGAGTADLLRVANSGAGSTVTYDIVLIGASA